jgi:hypothetical protein
MSVYIPCERSSPEWTSIRTPVDVTAISVKRVISRPAITFHRRGLIVNVGRRHFLGDILILCCSVGRLYVHLLDLHVVIFCKTVVSNVGLNRAIQSCSEVGHSSYKIIGCSST